MKDFTCPKCGSHSLVEISTTTNSTEIDGLSDDGFIEYKPMMSAYAGQSSKYVCGGSLRGECDFTVPATDEKGLAEWLKTGKQ